MQPVTQDIEVYQGDTFDFFFRVREREWDAFNEVWVAGAYVDLTNWTGKSQIRQTHEATEVLAEFAVTISNQAVTPGGVLLVLTPAQTAALPPRPTAPSLPPVWDIQLTNPAGEVRTFIKGNVLVSKEVTRA